MSNKEKVVLTAKEAMLYTILVKKYGIGGVAEMVLSMSLQRTINDKLAEVDPGVSVNLMEIPEGLEDLTNSLFDKFLDSFENNKDLDVVDPSEGEVTEFLDFLKSKGYIEEKKE